MAVRAKAFLDIEEEYPGLADSCCSDDEDEFESYCEEIGEGEEVDENELAIAKPIKQKRSSSISALYNSGYINRLDAKEVNISLALFMEEQLHQTIKNRPKRRGSIFDENIHPLAPGTNTETLPTIQDIYKNVLTILLDNYLPPQVSILTMGYVQKFVSTSNIKITPSNYRRVLLAAAVLSTKMWEDAAIWNCDFVTLFPYLSIEDLNRLEVQFLKILDYETTTSAVAYAQHYFKLRELSQSNQMDWAPISPSRRPSIEYNVDEADHEEKNIKKKTNRSQSVPFVASPLGKKIHYGQDHCEVD